MNDRPLAILEIKTPGSRRALGGEQEPGIYREEGQFWMFAGVAAAAAPRPPRRPPRRAPPAPVLAVVAASSPPAAPRPPPAAPRPRPRAGGAAGIVSLVKLGGGVSQLATYHAA